MDSKSTGLPTLGYPILFSQAQGIGSFSLLRVTRTLGLKLEPRRLQGFLRQGVESS